MICSAPYYWITCDLCGERPSGGDYTAWQDRDTAHIEPEASGWCCEGGNHLCPDCIPPLPDEDDE